MTVTAESLGLKTEDWTEIKGLVWHPITSVYDVDRELKTIIHLKVESTMTWDEIVKRHPPGDCETYPFETELIKFLEMDSYMSLPGYCRFVVTKEPL